VKAICTSANWHVRAGCSRSIFTLGVVNRENARARERLTLARRGRLLLIDYPRISSTSFQSTYDSGDKVATVSLLSRVSSDKQRKTNLTSENASADGVSSGHSQVPDLADYRSLRIVRGNTYVGATLVKRD